MRERFCFGALAAEFLKQTLHEFLHVLMELCYHVFVTGDVPHTWKRIMFRMLAQKLQMIFILLLICGFVTQSLWYMIFHRLESVWKPGSRKNNWSLGAFVGWNAAVDGKSGYRQNPCLQRSLVDFEFGSIKSSW